MHKRTSSGQREKSVAGSILPTQNGKLSKRHGKRHHHSTTNALSSSSTKIACCALASALCLSVQFSIKLIPGRTTSRYLPDISFPFESSPPEEKISAPVGKRPEQPPPLIKQRIMTDGQIKSDASPEKIDVSPKGAGQWTDSLSAKSSSTIFKKKAFVPPRVIRLESIFPEHPKLNSDNKVALPTDDSTDILLSRPYAASVTTIPVEDNRPANGAEFTNTNTSWIDEEDTEAEDKDAAIQDKNTDPGNIDSEGVDECVPMAKWQSSVPVNCNSFHELDFFSSITNAGGDETPHENDGNKRQRHSSDTMPVSAHIRHLQIPRHNWDDSRMKFLGQGWFRAAWRLDQWPPGHVSEDDEDSSGTETVILKMLRPERDFTAEFYELHRIDAVAMEQLTSSQFVLNVYGYCGQSALNEFANFKIPELSSLEKFDRQLRGKKHPRIDRMKLKLAVSVATGVADMHELSADLVGDNRPAIVHYDLNPRNVAIVKGGLPKLNDFNVAHFLKWNPRTNETCGFEGRLHEPWWRAPEEVSRNGTGPLTSAIDVYSLGNLLFHILTTHSPRGKMKAFRMEEVRKDVLQGIPPHIPTEYATAADPASVAIRKAMNKCFAREPGDRAPAREIANDLLDAYMQMIEEEEAQPKKVRTKKKKSK